MKKNFTLSLKTIFWFFMLFCTIQNLNAQVGIGTTSPAASSVLDITSTTQGLLMPRMTTAQKNTIVTPANGLMVYDADLKGFSYYDLPATTWVNVSQGRSKFKRIKSTDVLAAVLAAELSAGGGSKYLLDSQTLYEINGTVTLNFPIELNNAYLVGLDSSDDKLIKATGDLFTGTTGGSIRVLTLVATGGNVFNINGGGTQNLIFRDMIITSSANVGLIQNFNLVFSSIIQYVGNANGFIYRDISKLLLDNQGWFGNNTGVFEKFEGTFGSIQKQGGFSDVNGAAIGMDFSLNPLINADGIIENVNFAGTLSTGKYVNPYTGAGTYAGFNFNNKWNVNCSGIPYEGDRVAVGDINYDYPVGSGASTTLSGTAVKLLGTTTSNNLYRASRNGVDNRIQYLGNKKRFFKIGGSASFQATATNTIYIFYIAKNGTVVNQSKVYVNSNSTTDILAVPLQSIVELSPNDYVEVFAQRFSGTGNILTVSMNLIIN
ncbi:hypothetical protein [uncultured Flavobacterium sp.]|uniref:hypothetical protein n=1 Tax=uncultured Flavobacterium sp. TaxID=165435 RepID=UPI0030EDC3DA